MFPLPNWRKREEQMRKKGLLIGIIGVLLLNQTISAQTWLSAKRLTRYSGSSMHPAVATDSGNHIHTVWQDITPGNYEIYYKRSTNGGVTWHDKRSPGNDEIFYKRSIDGGKNWSSVKRISWTSGGSYGAALATGLVNTIHLIWFDNSPGNYEICYKKGIQ